MTRPLVHVGMGAGSMDEDEVVCLQHSLTNCARLMDELRQMAERNELPLLGMEAQEELVSGLDHDLYHLQELQVLLAFSLEQARLYQKLTAGVMQLKEGFRE